MRAVSSLLLGALALQSAGCYSTIRSTSHFREEVAETRVIPTGTQVDVSEVVPGSAYRVAETAVCRTGVFGTRIPYTVSEKQKEGDGSKALFLLGGLSLVLGLAAAPGDDDGGSSSSGGGSSGSAAMSNALMGLGVGLAALGALIWLAPERIESRDEGEPQPLARWDGAAVPCEGARPVHLPMADVVFAARFAKASEPLVQFTRTDAEGIARFRPEVPRLVCGFCGDATVSVELPGVRAATGDDTPAAPDRGRRLSGPRTFSLSSGASRTSLASLRDLDTDGGLLARGCCGSGIAQAERSACVESCAAAGGVAHCLRGGRACEAAARGSEFPSRAAALCASLFEECLKDRGTSPANLQTCERICVDKRARRTCG